MQKGGFEHGINYRLASSPAHIVATRLFLLVAIGTAGLTVFTYWCVEKLTCCRGQKEREENWSDFTALTKPIQSSDSHGTLIHLVWCSSKCKDSPHSQYNNGLIVLLQP